MMDRAVDFWPIGMMEIIMQRDFKGIWIQAEIWLDDRLSAIDKIVLMEIDSLDRSEDGCFASNQSLAEFCKCSERKVSDSISKLTNLGYIRISGFDGRIRHIKSNVKTDSQKMRDRVAKSARQTSKICEADTQKMRISNITINNNDNNNDYGIGQKRKRFVRPTLDEVKEYCIERKNNVDPQKFFDHYEANGWKVGKNSMKDWKAAVRYWERSGYNGKKVGPNGIVLNPDADDDLDGVF